MSNVEYTPVCTENSVQCTVYSPTLLLLPTTVEGSQLELCPLALGAQGSEVQLGHRKLGTGPGINLYYTVALKSHQNILI